MRGFYNAPEQTAKAFDAEGWLRTGDLGYRDADGYYFITGRLKELIIKGGENIAPREIDEALLRHPAVLEAAAVGVPDANFGQDILACVVLREGARATETELREFCLRELGRYKTPRAFRFVAELPKGPSGKVQRLKLAET
jgi:long-chain acyl-CoA synthetase